MLEDSTQQNAAIVNTVLAISGALLFTFWAITRSSSNGAPKGCRMLGLPLDQSNLSDEYDPKWVDGVPAPSTDAQGRPAWRVKALFTYPIKSCAGIELDIAHVVSTGFLHDRQFCFAENVKSTQASQIDRCASGENQSTNWVARTLRNSGFNKLALVRPEIWVPDPSAPGYTPDLEQVKSQGVLVVYYPHIGRNILQSALLGIGICLGLIPCEKSFHIPLKPPPDQETTYSLTPVKIWKDSPLAYDYGKHIPDSFHRFLSCSGTEQRRENGRITLFRVCSSSHREIFRNAPRKKDLGFQPTTGFADAYPIHLLSLSSVRDVAARCAIAIPHLSIRRFRANVIIQGPGAFAEDDWKRIRILPSSSSTSSSSSSSSSSSLNGILREGKRDTEGTIIHTVCRTIRCKLPNVDPDTGVRHPAEPDATLRSYRRIDPGETRYACLGMQGVPAVQGVY